MEEIVKDVATPVVESLVAKAVKELEYLRHYNKYVGDFEKKKESLSAKRGTLLKDIKEAKDRNENEIENEVDLWLRRANGLIKEDTKRKKKWFGLVTNCCWQYKQGKALAGKIQEIEELIEKSNFPHVARKTGLPVIEFYSSQNFMHLDDRKSKFEELKELLKDDNKFRIGLYGLGGTGKTTMAIEAVKEVAKSRVFDKVIFVVVSNSKDENLKEIRDNIVKHLIEPHSYEQMDESVKAKELWKRIAEGGENVLIILDDIWKQLALGDIGIPLGRRGKGRCAILLTTRDGRVCTDMGCDGIIELKVLDEKDAVDLFLSYAGKSIDDSSNDFKHVAKDIVKECGRLPVAIVAMAKALMKHRHQTESEHLTGWKQGLERLQNRESIHGVDEELQEAYNSLRLSYHYLKNEKAKKLFLLCSLFHEDYEIPIELLTRIAIGLGLCGEYTSYSIARSYFRPIIDKLIDCCLLINVGNGYVKMHDLVRDVALWIGNELVQVVMDSSTTLMDNIQYSFWNVNNFPSHFDGRTLEVLLFWISNAAGCTTATVPDDIFEGMENLKFLALRNQSYTRISGVSLFQSHPSLKNVRTLAIQGFNLGDISILVNLKRLESLELSECLIKLPKEIKDLEKLRLLEIVRCDIERNNPFEVIGSCLQLEELYFVSNSMDEDTFKSPSQITTFPKLKRYMIKARSWFRHYEVDFSIFGYFDSKDLRVNFSDEILKSFMARAEVFKLDGKYCNGGWTNVVPDILHVKDDSMEDHLTRLRLQSMKGIECLIRTESLRPGVVIFSKLVKLKLFDMNVRELCCGLYPVNFLKQLEKLHLSECKNMEGSLFDGKLELCNLKSIRLHECSMTCLFHPFTAQSLKQLEKFHIKECSELKDIVAAPMEDHDPNQKSHDSIFPKLKYLEVQSCPELEFVLPICFCKDLPLLESMEVGYCENVEYIFGQYPEQRDLHQMGTEAILQSLEELKIYEAPNFMNIYAECYLPPDEVQKSSTSTKVEDGSSSLSRSPLCWFWPKSNASTIYHPSPFMNHNQAMKVNYGVNRARRLFTPPLYPYTLFRRLEISGLVGLKSLFTLSIVSSLKLLEILDVRSCKTLKHIVIVKEDGHDYMNGNSIFPNLREVTVFYCSHLEYLFPAFYSKDFQYLEYVNIFKAKKLTHVFGKCEADQNHNVQVDLNLPALKRLDLDDIPKIVSICAQNYSMKELYLEDISLGSCPQLLLETLIDLLVVGHKRQEDLSSKKVLPPQEKGKSIYNLQELPKFKDPKNYTSFQNLSKLRIEGCKQLKFILSASTSRMLQKLKELHVSECEELVSIIEEDEESKKNPMAPHQVSFPELRTLEVSDCKSMKYLFSISSGKLPRLLCVDIEDTPQLGEVFRWKHWEGQELAMQDVFPRLYAIRLVNLPALHTICQGIDFHTLKFRLVRKCPAIALTSVNTSREELHELSHSLGRDSVVDVEDFRDVRFKIWEWIEEQRWMAIGEGDTEHKQNRISPNLSEIEVEGSQQDIGNDSTMPQENNGSPNFAKSEKVSKETAEENSTSNLPNLIESTNASANGTVEEKLSTTPSSDLDMNLKSTFGEGPSSEKYDKASSSNYSKPKIEKPYALAPSKELCGKESMGDQQAPEEPTNQCSSKETSNEMAITRKSPPISLISSPKKPQIETSAAQVESGNSAITNQSVQDNLVHKASSSTPSELIISNRGASASEELSEKESKGDQEALAESISHNEGPQRVKEPTIDLLTKETTNKVALEISTTNTEVASPLDPSISTPKKSQAATSTTPTEPKSSQSNLLDISITTECPQVEIMTNDETSTSEEEMKFDQKSSSQIFEEHDLMRLFQMMKEGDDMEVHLSYVSKLIADLHDNKEVSNALADLETSLKKGLNEIACSEERRLCLQNALNILSSHCSEDGAPSHGLQATIHSLQQEIQTIFSSFSQAYTTIDTFTKLEQKEKLMIEQCSKREKDAKTLIYDTNNTKNSIIEAQLNEAELKEQISKLQADLWSKEKEIEEYERKLLSLQEQEKKSVSDTIEFTLEFLAMERKKSRMVEDQMKARQQLENMEAKWPSCLSNLKKTMMLLGVHLKQKL